ncbi:hypothetical protein Emag_002487 [Eimeria magna]
MENLGSDQRPLLEQEEALDSPKGPSVASHHEDTAASAADSEDPYIEADVTKVARPARSRRLAFGALAAVALALVLATGLGKRLFSVEKSSPVKAPEDVGKGLPVVKEELEKPEAPVGKEGIKKDIPPEFKKAAAKIVQWARRTRGIHLWCHFEFAAGARLSPREASNISLEQQLIRNGVEYKIYSRFTTLTPDYDPEKTAAELAECLPKVFEECLKYEAHSNVNFLSRAFGDQVNGRINLRIRRESLFALSQFGPLLGALLLKFQSQCLSLKEEMHGLAAMDGRAAAAYADSSLAVVSQQLVVVVWLTDLWRHLIRSVSALAAALAAEEWLLEVLSKALHSCCVPAEAAACAAAAVAAGAGSANAATAGGEAFTAAVDCAVAAAAGNLASAS